MNKKYTWFLTAVVIVTVLIAGYLLLTTKAKETNQKNNTQNSAKTAKLKQIGIKTVELNASGFNPQTLTIESGTRIVWVNKSGADGSVNSDNHPTNLLFPFLNLGRFSSNTSVSVLFEKSGKYTYHNALNPDQKGTIVVK